MRQRLLASFLLAISIAPAAADTLVTNPVRAFAKGDAAFAFDSSRRHLVVVGGKGAAGPLVQVLDLGAPVARWDAPSILGTPPPPADLTNVPAVFDPVRDRVIVLFQGTMWSLSLAAPMTWSHVTPSGTAPVTLEGATAIYDPVRDRIVGFSRNGSASETWQLSLGASPAWAALPYIGVVPPWRVDAAVAYDATADRMIVMGGETSGGPSNDTWQLAFAGTPMWSALAVTGVAPATFGPSYGFDPVARSLYVVGPTAGTGTYRLDLAAATWNYVPVNENPPTRSQTATAWDTATSRLVVAGGLESYSYPRGDLWQLVGTNWSRLPASGGHVDAANWADYDEFGHRWPARADAAPAFLSMVDSSWTIVGPKLRAFRAPYGDFYDPSSNLYGAWNLDTLFTIHPGVDADWARSALSGAKPAFDYPGTVYHDRPNHRLLVIGGEQFGHIGGTRSPGMWSLDYAGGAWTLLAGSTPLGIRSTPPIHDTGRNRVLFYGGAVLNSSSPPGAAGDLWSLDLATLAWSQPAATGTSPGTRYYFPASYDPTRDRAVVFGGITYGNPLHGVYDLQFAPGDADGAWSRNDPDGEPVPDYPGMIGAMDPGLDRFLVPGASSWYELSFSVPTPPLVLTCPPKTAWVPGSNLVLTFRLKQKNDFAVNYQWTLTSRRNWPGFPLQGIQQLDDSTAVDLGISVLVPDTAAAGIDTLGFTITDGSIADSCTVLIGDQNSPALWALIEARLVGGRSRLAWWTADRTHAAADVERRVGDGAWEPAGTAPIGGDGTVRFEDAAIAPGTRYAYRAGIAGAAWSDPVVIDVPALTGTLAFARSSLVARGALEVAFTLPGTGPARLEAFDLAGRRVAVRTASGAGPHAESLGALPGGVYFLRLTQDGTAVTARAVVLRGRD